MKAKTIVWNPQVKQTAMTAYNHDRSSTNTATLIAYYDPTVTGDGTILEIGLIGADDIGPKGVGGNGEQRLEWMLDPSEQYLIRFVADNADTKVLIKMYWYEHS